MVHIDKYYKIVASTFGLAYFIGIIVSLIYVLRGELVVQTSLDFMTNLFLSNKIYFKQTLNEVFTNAINLFAIPFAYLIAAVQFGFMHIDLLTSSFLGQVKLLVQIIPQFMFFTSYIIFSTLGIKTILFIVKKFLNNFIIKENKYKIKEKFFRKDDIYLFYIGLILIVVGSAIQINLIRVLFIFFINLRIFSYAILIIIYLVILTTSLLIIYKTIKEYLKKNKKD